LQRHGIAVEELREEIELDVEVYRVGHATHGAPFQNHALTSVDVASHTESRRVPAGTILVRTGQPLGTLAAYLLEPQAEDGLGAWNLFDACLKVGSNFPVLRLLSPVPLTKGRVRPLTEERPQKKPITLEALDAGQLPNFHG